MLAMPIQSFQIIFDLKRIYRQRSQILCSINRRLILKRL